MIIVPLNYYFHSTLINYKLVNLENKTKNIESIVSIDPILLNLTFSVGRIYHHNGIAYDYYSQNELGQSKADSRWKIWLLPHELNISSIDHIEISPFVVSKLPFVDMIYVITDTNLIQRHENLKKAFHYQGISNESIDYRLKWNYTICNSKSSHSYVYQRLNLKENPLGNYIYIN